ncbi:MAG TPA: GatB/YqeY domain-containing protein [Tepidisphaeraceae bacterium]|nr:GatB/YqeY domain-containing protein [Tepidisphaeraceae bacterium]
MELLTKLQEDMKTAMKSGQKDRLSVIRMLLSDVKNIDLAPKPITAEETVAAYGKKLRKSQEEYQKLGKAAEVEKLRFEISVVDEYLPKKASSENTEKLINEFLAKNTFTEKQFGQAMGAFMKTYGTMVEPAAANQMLRKALAGK